MADYQDKGASKSKYVVKANFDVSVVEGKVRFFENLSNSDGSPKSAGVKASHSSGEKVGAYTEKGNVEIGFSDAVTKSSASSYETTKSDVYLEGGQAAPVKRSVTDDIAVDADVIYEVPELAESSKKGAFKGDIKNEQTRHNPQGYLPQPEPTIVDCADFDPVKDAQDLRKAMKGWGADEGKIMEIITGRSNRQRQEIINAFRMEFGRDGKEKEGNLIEDLKKELGGDFEDVIVGLMLPPVEYEARELRKAMKGLGTNEQTVIEILLTKTNDEMQKLVDVYNSLYETPLNDRICSEVSGDLQRLLVMAISCARKEDLFDAELACTQADALYNAGEAKLGTDEEQFVRIFGQSSRAQLRAVFEEYKKRSGVTLEQAVECEFSGDLKCALLTVIRCTQNRYRYYAERLHKAMEGLGTDDCTLIRILVSRSEIDLGNIKREYECLYGATLLSAVKSETSGCYKNALCAIIGAA